MLEGLRLVSEAADLAARRHSGMQRKGRGSEPYINHLAEVANLLSIAIEGADAELVAAGWLHDTIEDTETTHRELAEKFGERVAALVVEVTDDMTLPKDERRRRQVVEAPRKSPGPKLIKLADKISNIRARILLILSASLINFGPGDFLGASTTCLRRRSSFGKVISSVTSTTSAATRSPNFSASSRCVVSVSSMVSCSQPAATSSASAPSIAIESR